jgi:hypothetical protein
MNEAGGELATKVDSATGETTGYVYDALGNLALRALFHDTQSPRPDGRGSGHRPDGRCSTHFTARAPGCAHPAARPPGCAPTRLRGWIRQVTPTALLSRTLR